MLTDIPAINCHVVVETMSVTGHLSRRKKSKHSACVALARGQTGILCCKVQFREGELLFSTRGGASIHGRLWEQGRATLRLVGQRTHILMSRANPDDLYQFLSFLGEKLKGGQRAASAPAASAPVRKRKRVEIDENSGLKEVYEAAAVFRAPTVLKSISPSANPVKRKRGLSRAPGPLSQGDAVTASQRVSLSAEQQGVLSRIQAGYNVFFTGGAGTGKSFLLKHIIRQLPPKSTFATAPTGVAACNIDGMTLHTFSGVSLEEPGRTPKKLNNWRSVKHLVIDEISMVDGRYFDELDRVARHVKKNSEPFGGIQLILCGDFFQLPPVTKGNDERVFCFEAAAWASCVDECIELKEVRRQKDLDFISILRDIRIGVCTAGAVDILRKTSKRNAFAVEPTALCTHVREAEGINGRRLADLDTETKAYDARDELNHPRAAKLVDRLCSVSKRLELKVGAQVLLTKNLDVGNQLVNGARGVVQSFKSGLPVVKFVNGAELTVSPASFFVKGCGTRRQLPLKLAWAISIHKSQGMSIDYVQMNLSRVFECGQAYVALSRATSLEGLQVTHFNAECVRADPKVLEFYRRLKMV